MLCLECCKSWLPVKNIPAGGRPQAGSSMVRGQSSVARGVPSESVVATKPASSRRFDMDSETNATVAESTRHDCCLSFGIQRSADHDSIQRSMTAMPTRRLQHVFWLQPAKQSCPKRVPVQVKPYPGLLVKACALAAWQPDCNMCNTWRGKETRCSVPRCASHLRNNHDTALQACGEARAQRMP